MPGMRPEDEPLFGGIDFPKRIRRPRRPVAFEVLRSMERRDHNGQIRDRSATARRRLLDGPDVSEKQVVDVGVGVVGIAGDQGGELGDLEQQVAIDPPGAGIDQQAAQRGVNGGRGVVGIEQIDAGQVGIRDRGDGAIDVVIPNRHAVERIEIVGDGLASGHEGMSAEQAQHVGDEAVASGPESALVVRVAGADDQLFEGVVEERVGGEFGDRGLGRLGVVEGRLVFLRRVGECREAEDHQQQQQTEHHQQDRSAPVGRGDRAPHDRPRLVGELSFHGSHPWRGPLEPRDLRTSGTVHFVGREHPTPGPTSSRRQPHTLKSSLKPLPHCHRRTVTVALSQRHTHSAAANSGFAQLAVPWRPNFRLC